MPYGHSIVDANGWPSEPDTGSKKLKPFRRNKQRDKMFTDKDTKTPDEPELEREEEKDITPEPELEPVDNSAEDEKIMFAVRMERIRKQLEIKKARDALIEALDLAIAAEKELGKMLYAIEDRKKNTLTAADYIHGDDADFASIIDSANIAKAKAIELPNALLDIASDKAQHLTAVMNQSMIGRGIASMTESGLFDMDGLSDDIREKLDTLKEVIEENKSNDMKFTAETPYDVDKEDYESAMNENGVIPDVKQVSPDIEPEF